MCTIPYSTVTGIVFVCTTCIKRVMTKTQTGTSVEANRHMHQHTQYKIWTDIAHAVIRTLLNPLLLTACDTIDFRTENIIID